MLGLHLVFVTDGSHLLLSKTNRIGDARYNICCSSYSGPATYWSLANLVS